MEPARTTSHCSWPCGPATLTSHCSCACCRATCAAGAVVWKARSFSSVHAPARVAGSGGTWGNSSASTSSRFTRRTSASSMGLPCVLPQHLLHHLTLIAPALHPPQPLRCKVRREPPERRKPKKLGRHHSQCGEASLSGVNEAACRTPLSSPAALPLSGDPRVGKRNASPIQHSRLPQGS
jgi:hypothetical protein